MNIAIQIRFADVDMMGIVHNAVYLHYFEQARLEYFTSHLGGDWDWIENGFILAKNEVEYHVPLYLTDKPLIDVHVDKIGSKSFVLGYTVYTRKKEKVIHATGASTIVCMNHKEKATISIPEALKKFLESHN